MSAEGREIDQHLNRTIPQKMYPPPPPTRANWMFKPPFNPPVISDSRIKHYHFYSKRETLEFKYTWCQCIFRRLVCIRNTKLQLLSTLVSPGLTSLFHRAKEVLTAYDIPDDLIINIDQTPLSSVLIGPWSASTRCTQPNVFQLAISQTTVKLHITNCCDAIK